MTVRRPAATPAAPGSRARVPGAVGSRASRHRPGRGAVTAETAVVLPLLVAFALALGWLVATATTQVRVVDSAREVARAMARDVDRGEAVALGRRVAPEGSRITVEESDEVVTVRVAATVRGPGGLLSFLPRATVTSTAVAAREPG